MHSITRKMQSYNYPAAEPLTFWATKIQTRHIAIVIYT